MTQWLTQPQAHVWIVSALTAAGLATLLYFTRQDESARLRRCLKRLGPEHLLGVLLPDGIGSTVYVDCLLLTGGGIIVLDVHRYAGLLFGAANTHVWTQMVQSRSYKFKNPLPLNQARVQAVKLLVPEVPVLGRVVFTRDGQFPRGIPEGVSMLATLEQDLAPRAGAGSVPEKFVQAWQRLQQQVQGTVV